MNRIAFALHDDDGPVVDGHVWADPANDVDRRVLARARPPVLDIGCGPARHTIALAERGHVALGIDITDGAVSFARERGAPVLRRGVFDAVPAAGRWRSALLLDGNLGIGGEPVTLLRRVGQLVAARGVVLVETGPPSYRQPTITAHLVVAGRRGPRFRWAYVAADALDAVATAAGLTIADAWCDGGRWFAGLERV